MFRHIARQLGFRRDVFRGITHAGGLLGSDLPHTPSFPPRIPYPPAAHPSPHFLISLVPIFLSLRPLRPPLIAPPASPLAYLIFFVVTPSFPAVALHSFPPVALHSFLPSLSTRFPPSLSTHFPPSLTPQFPPSLGPQYLTFPVSFPLVPPSLTSPFPALLTSHFPPFHSPLVFPIYSPSFLRYRSPPIPPVAHPSFSPFRSPSISPVIHPSFPPKCFEAFPSSAHPSSPSSDYPSFRPSLLITISPPSVTSLSSPVCHLSPPWPPPRLSPLTPPRSVTSHPPAPPPPSVTSHPPPVCHHSLTPRLSPLTPPPSFTSHSPPVPHPAFPIIITHPSQLTSSLGMSTYSISTPTLRPPAVLSHCPPAAPLAPSLLSSFSLPLVLFTYPIPSHPTSPRPSHLPPSSPLHIPIASLPSSGIRNLFLPYSQPRPNHFNSHALSPMEAPLFQLVFELGLSPPLSQTA
ncbi:unnamed protein product [Closterium sp. Naga37s-1]|nr:unnamed protein product [Closterium sp. Naga37s-1]